MVIVYNEELESYYQILIGANSIYDECDIYEVTDDLLLDNLSGKYDNGIQAYRVTDEWWQNFKKEIEEWLYSDGVIYQYDEDRFYEIMRADPLYNVYDLRGTLDSEDVTMEYIKNYYNGTSEYRDLKEHEITPIPAPCCNFRHVLRKWSGKI